ADHRLPYFAAPMVRASVMKKLSALMSFPEQQFERYFVPHDLTLDTWNMIQGLEAMPVFSPHPVETTVIFFRALWHGGYKTYAHFADICSMEQLDRLLTGGDEMSRTILDRVRHNYSIPVDIKKLDIGGGIIHGVAEDFCDDQSARIVLSHTSLPLTLREKEIGADTSFGMADVLIRSANKQPEASIRHLLRQNYPAVPDHDIALLANCPTRTLSIGSILIKKDSHVDAIYLLTNGLVETVESETNTHNIVTAGSMIGERNCLLGEISRRTYRAASFIRVLEIPRDLYRSFIERNDLEEAMREYLERKYFLEGTYLFGDRISGATRNAITHALGERTAESGERIVPDDSILAVAEGTIEVHCGDRHIYTARPSEVIGGVQLLGDDLPEITYVAHTACRCYFIPCAVVEEIPIVRWKLLEQINRTMRSCISAFQG
ncbi:MAG: cyclic nucleotide-binding domain-containing protein, partial [Spirochaetales bacterium]|nr:cyclic nucleotide-binding domain-containing protein [Spirochaetales bacterium]